MNGEACRLAQNLARNCGLAVFPCRNDNSPACPHGFKDATPEPAAIARLWRDHPGPLIGVRTGAASGSSVLDIDQKHPEAVAWWRASHKLLLPTRVFRTRSGGLHLWMQHRDGVTNTQGKIARGVDTRGQGGYVICWWCAGVDCLDHSPAAPWPDWLFAAIASPTPRPRRAYRPDGDTNGGRRLDAIICQLGNAREGERNGVLFWAACRCAEMQLPQARIESLLTKVALGIGLREYEIRRTIASAIRRVAA
jgi:hypothetical protein